MRFSTLLMSASASVVAAAPALEPRTKDYTVNVNTLESR